MEDSCKGRLPGTPQDPASAARKTEFLLVGASNLRFLYPALAGALLAAADGPARVRVACGIGRSYWLRAGAFGRRTPAVGASGILEAFLTAPAPERGGALVMDMGNDILYGLPEAALVSPLATLVGRLARAGVATLVVPPQADPAGFTPARYAAVRRLYYPSSTVPLAGALAGLAATKRALERLAGDRTRLVAGLTPLLSPDRIHYSPRHWVAVANRLLAGLGDLTGRPFPAVDAAGFARALLASFQAAPRRAPARLDLAPDRTVLLY